MKMTCFQGWDLNENDLCQCLSKLCCLNLSNCNRKLKITQTYSFTLVTSSFLHFLTISAMYFDNVCIAFNLSPPFQPNTKVFELAELNLKNPCDDFIFPLLLLVRNIMNDWFSQFSFSQGLWFIEWLWYSSIRVNIILYIQNRKNKLSIRAILIFYNIFAQKEAKCTTNKIKQASIWLQPCAPAASSASFIASILMRGYPKCNQLQILIILTLPW